MTESRLLNVRLQITPDNLNFDYVSCNNYKTLFRFTNACLKLENSLTLLMQYYFMLLLFLPSGSQFFYLSADEWKDDFSFVLFHCCNQQTIKSDLMTLCISPLSFFVPSYFRHFPTFACSCPCGFKLLISLSSLCSLIGAQITQASHAVLDCS